MKYQICFWSILGVLVCFSERGLAKEEPTKECERVTIERLKKRIEKEFQYSAACNLSTTGLSGCIDALETLALALVAPETKGREFESVFVTESFWDVRPGSTTVFVKAGAGVNEIQCHLASQRLRFSPAVVREQKIKAEINLLREAIKSRSKIGVYCNWDTLGGAGCVEALRKLLVALEDSNTHGRDFKSIYVADKFNRTDVGEVVHVDGRAGASAIKAHLLRQRAGSSEEVKVERLVREHITSLEASSKKISGCHVFCVVPQNGLNESLQGMEKLHAALSRIGKKAAGLNIYLMSRSKCLSPEGDVWIDHRLSSQEMEQEILAADRQR